LAAASRHGDDALLDFYAEGRHLVIGVVATTVYRNTVIRRVAYIPGYVAKHAEDRKIFTNRTYTQPIAKIHRVPHGIVRLSPSRMGGAWELMPLLS